MRVAFTGCSLTVGEGFPEDQRDQFIYNCLVSKHFDFDKVNFSQPGASNYKIFMQAGPAVVSKEFDIVFVQWPVFSRMWISPGPDIHLYLSDPKITDFRYRDLYVSSSELTKFKNMVRLLNHDYQNIHDMINYCKFLDTMAKQTKTKIVYINGGLPWTDDLCNPLTDDLSSCLSAYSKNLLDFDNCNDTEIVTYFSKLQEKFKNIDQSKWVNLFDSFVENSVDLGPEGHHPGIKSHQWLANKIINHLTQRKII